MSTGIYNFFKYITDNFGMADGVMFIICVLIIGLAILLIRTFPNAIRSYYKNEAMKHIQQTNNRKDASLKIMEILSEVVREYKLKRAIVFEYSNGHSNIAGFPFLYFNATYEKDNVGEMSISQGMQHINTSLFTDFIEDLNNNMLVTIDDKEKIKDKWPTMYQLLSDYKFKNIIFYAMHGPNQSVGFVGYEYENIDSLNLIGSISETAQRVNLLLNGNDDRQV